MATSSSGPQRGRGGSQGDERPDRGARRPNDQPVPPDGWYPSRPSGEAPARGPRHPGEGEQPTYPSPKQWYCLN